jgi:hypothetical protein
MPGGSAIRPRWPPQCSCVVIENVKCWRTKSDSNSSHGLKARWAKNVVVLSVSAALFWSLSWIRIITKLPNTKVWKKIFSQPISTKFAEMILGWSPSKNMPGGSAIRPRWPPQCSCVVIESSFDRGERFTLINLIFPLHVYVPLFLSMQL